MSVNNKRKPLDKLKSRAKRCQSCELYKKRAKIVFGSGPPNAKIMVISEAPGREEDLTGLPFMGRAGRLLNKLLSSTGLKREKIYITNILKCRPPHNRKPKREEIAACLPYLLEQIDIINPPEIILLGGVAFSVFFPKQKLGKFRGCRTKKEGRQFFVTYHPAAGLRFPKMKKILEKDFKEIDN